MYTDEDEPITLSKWPFYLGDILLVAAGLTIAIAQDWMLSSGQIAACVAAVALGACLFVLPYIVEFQIRVREEREDRSSELHVLRKHIATLEEALELAVERIQGIERQQAPSEQAIELLSNSLEQQSAELETIKEAQKAEIVALQKALEAIQAKASQTDPAVAQSIEAIDAKVTALTECKDLEKIAKRVEVLENAPAPEPIIKEVIKEVPATVVAEPEFKPEVAAEPVAAEPEEGKKPRRSRRERQKPEPRLLNRAIKENQDSSSAVSRIITSKSKPKAEPEPKPETKAEPEPEPKPAETKPAVEATEPEEQQGVKSDGSEVSDKQDPAEAVEVPISEVSTKEPEPEPEPKPGETKPVVEATEPEEQQEAKSGRSEVSDEQDPAEDVEVPASEVSTKEPEPDPAKEATVLEETPAEPALAPVEDTPSEEVAGDMVNELFAEVPTASPKASSKPRKADTVVTANIFIGIGNKPFIRGNGGGLKPEEGIAMEFVEIGKWQWAATEPFEDAVEFQIYRNDEEADKKGPQKLESGQKLAISPKF